METEKSEFLFISETANVLGRAAATVRNYEKRGLLKVAKTSRGTRVFRRADVEELRRKLRREGK